MAEKSAKETEAKPAKASAKKNGKGAKKKGLGSGFYIGIVLIFVLPAIGLLGWYSYSVLGVFAEEKQKALDEKAKKLAAEAARLAKLAKKKHFRVEDFDACEKIRNQYLIPAGVIYTEFTQRQLVGLSKFASDEQVKERCIKFAKAVTPMERMSHHDRHVYVCQTAQFNADKQGKYNLTPDKLGRGVRVNRGTQSKLHPIGVGRSILLSGWQVYNQGDGCIIIGLSKAGVFTFTGSVQMKDEDKKKK